jgi:type IV pilus assembly protein PilX
MSGTRCFQLSQRGNRQRGMVLVTSLLMLVVVTILAIGLFRTFGLDEKIAGNTREKQRALQAAVSAQQFAEWWLSVGNAVNLMSCSGNYTTASVPICVNTLPSAVTGGSANIASLPWTVGGVATQVTYVPPNMTFANGTNATITKGTYFANPVFYISYLGVGTGANGATGILFQIDAAGYGGSPNTAAVVESTYLLQTADTDLSGT